MSNLTNAVYQAAPEKIDFEDKPEESPKKSAPTEEDIERFISNGLVCYNDFGAKGDGQIDDIEPIAATYEFANQHNITVKTDKELPCHTRHRWRIPAAAQYRS